MDNFKWTGRNLYKGNQKEAGPCVEDSLQPALNVKMAFYGTHHPVNAIDMLRGVRVTAILSCDGSNKQLQKLIFTAGESYTCFC